MTKEFIPYQQALALKELGFDEKCFDFYYKHPFEGIVLADLECPDDGSIIHLCEAPLYQQAFRWVREKHRLIFQIKYLFNGNYAVVIHKNTHEYMNTIQDLTHACVYEIPDNYSYEEAELACLRKLIELTNQNKDK